MSYPNPLPGGDAIILRDPAICYNQDSGLYYVFSTGSNILMFTSSSLTGPWVSAGAVLPNGSGITGYGDPHNPWAPDISYVNGNYMLYYALSSGIGSQVSAIGLATSPSMEANSWQDQGLVLSSNSGGPFNAIDPNLFQSDVGLKLTFGSGWSGIFQAGLSQDGKSLTTSPISAFLVEAADRDTTAEAGFIYKSPSSDYYFCFFSEGFTPLEGDPNRPRGTEYRVLVGRGNQPQGPFYDQEGKQLTEDDPSAHTGSLVLWTHDNIYAPGGQSVYFDPVSQRDIMVYHYAKLDETAGPSYLGINYLDFSSGWPVVVD